MDAMVARMLLIDWDNDSDWDRLKAIAVNLCWCIREFNRSPADFGTLSCVRIIVDGVSETGKSTVTIFPEGAGVIGVLCPESICVFINNCIWCVNKSVNSICYHSVPKIRFWIQQMQFKVAHPGKGTTEWVMMHDDPGYAVCGNTDVLT